MAQAAAGPRDRWGMHGTGDSINTGAAATDALMPSHQVVTMSLCGSARRRAASVANSPISYLRSGSAEVGGKAGRVRWCGVVWWVSGAESCSCPSGQRRCGLASSLAHIANVLRMRPCLRVRMSSFRKPTIRMVWKTQWCSSSTLRGAGGATNERGNERARPMSE